MVLRALKKFDQLGRDAMIDAVVAEIEIDYLVPETMATKEDILEQIVEEYLLRKGYFVRHNVKFIPRKDHPDFILNQDSNHSDIDVLGYHPIKAGDERVLAEKT